MGIWEENNPVQDAVMAEPVVPVEPSVVQGQPVAQSAPIEHNPQQTSVPQPVGLPVRVNDDRIFLLLNGKKHWITNADVYRGLGFKFGDERKIDAETLSIIPEGEPLK